MGMPARRIPAGIETPGRVNTINHHIRLDAPDTPMDNHRRRLKTERRPKSDHDGINHVMKCDAIGADFLEESFAKARQFSSFREQA
jgi:hypothetical protein